LLIGAMDGSAFSPIVAGLTATLTTIALIAVITTIVVVVLVRRWRRLKKKHRDALVL
jgi:membrane protein DedA with SNARE-associated domain